ncbi:MAG: hypothetical protein SOV16_10600 [Anaerobiospirillum succiniciproducens]|uniref:hypothetical protein n=1 Tax=Anaerobiospirillum succiniciproducens TaxID=13335 RepID=UPI002A74C358|nr:hypothetical protein [Anaerobiospirillum succiniciproducens]MDY2799588.1 hypothetical protein [Anaerobiospirillum succiniciproducens]
MPAKKKAHTCMAANISLTELELSRLHEMASTWGVTPSRMVAMLVNQVYESKAFLNGYESLSDKDRKALLERRAHLQNIKQVRSEAARKRSYDRRQGVNRGLTNMMVVCAPKRDELSKTSGISIPGVFCEKLGEVWLVPYGMLKYISSVEIMSYPCYESVQAYFADQRIPKSQVQNFISKNHNYKIESEGELNAIKQLYQEYGQELPELTLGPKLQLGLNRRAIDDFMREHAHEINLYLEIMFEVAKGDYSRLNELPEELRPTDESIEANNFFKVDPASYAALVDSTIKKNRSKLANAKLNSSNHELDAAVNEVLLDAETKDNLNASLSDRIASFNELLQTKAQLLDRFNAQDDDQDLSNESQETRILAPNFFASNFAINDSSFTERNYQTSSTTSNSTSYDDTYQSYSSAESSSLRSTTSAGDATAGSFGHNEANYAAAAVEHGSQSSAHLAISEGMSGTEAMGSKALMAGAAEETVDAKAAGTAEHAKEQLPRSKAQEIIERLNLRSLGLDEETISGIVAAHLQDESDAAAAVASSDDGDASKDQDDQLSSVKKKLKLDRSSQDKALDPDDDDAADDIDKLIYRGPCPNYSAKPRKTKVSKRLDPNAKQKRTSKKTKELDALITE